MDDEPNDPNNPHYITPDTGGENNPPLTPAVFEDEEPKKKNEAEAHVPSKGYLKQAGKAFMKPFQVPGEFVAKKLKGIEKVSSHAPTMTVNLLKEEDIKRLKKEAKKPKEKTATKEEPALAPEREQTSEEKAEEEINSFISEFNLDSLLPPLFDKLNEAQKLKVIRDLKRRIVGIVKSDAQTQYSDDFKNRSFIKKIASSVTKERDLKNLETEIFGELRNSDEGKKLITEDLARLTEITKNKEIIIHRGNPFVWYANVREISYYTENEEKAFHRFNLSAEKFANIPYEWGQERGGKNKRAYDKTETEYNEARAVVLDIRASRETAVEKGGALLKTLETDGVIKMEQLLNTHPQFEKLLNDFSRDAGFKEEVKSFVSFINTLSGKNFTNRFLIAGGASARMLAKFGPLLLNAGATVATASTLTAAPVVGGVVGYIRGRIRAKDTLSERQKQARHGQKDESAEANKVVSADNMIKHLETIINEINKYSGKYKREVLLERLRTRIDVTKYKIEQGLMNFGDTKSALNNQFNLINTLNQALAISFANEDSSEEELNKRLNRIMSFREENIADTQKAFIKKQALKGAVMGAGLASVGYAARWFGEHMGWWGGHGGASMHDRPDDLTQAGERKWIGSHFTEEGKLHGKDFSDRTQEFYDENGKITSSTKTFDDGHSEYYKYNNGIKTIEASYDAQGNEIPFDNSTPVPETSTPGPSAVPPPETQSPPALETPPPASGTPPPEPVPVAKPDTLLADATVHKGQGIEHTFIKQIEADPKKFGYGGKLDDVKAVHAYAQRQADIVAREHGYIDKAGNEVRVKVAGKAAYELQTDGHGKVTGVQEKFDGKIVDAKGVNKEYEYQFKVNKGGALHENIKGSAPTEAVGGGKVVTHAEGYATTETVGDQAVASSAIKNAGQENAPKTAEEAKRAALEKYTAPKIKGPEDGTESYDELRNKVAPTPETSKTFFGVDPKFLKNEFKLDKDKLAEAYQVYKTNLVHIFQGKYAGEWASMQNLPASEILGRDYAPNDPMMKYLHKLQDIIPEVKPKTGIAFIRKPETADEYVARVLQKASQLEKLKRVKFYR